MSNIDVRDNCVLNTLSEPMLKQTNVEILTVIFFSRQSNRFTDTHVRNFRIERKMLEDKNLPLAANQIRKNRQHYYNIHKRIKWVQLQNKYNFVGPKLR